MIRAEVDGEGLERILGGTAIVFRKWIKARDTPKPGEAVEAYSPDGDVVACGLWEPVGPVGLRILFHGPCPFRDPVELLGAKLESAFNARRRLGLVDTGSYRLVNSDGDLLSGLIVDIYASTVAVLQSSSAAIDVHLDRLSAAISDITGVRAIYEKSTQRSRKDIGLAPRARWMKGRIERVTIDEWGAKFIVDVERGQKTGFYLDQRFNRLEFRRYASGERVLDVFSYTGGFGLHAALEGAREIVFVEEDPVAVEILRQNLRINNVSRYRIVHGSVWDRLNGLERRHYTLIAVDPPAFIQRSDEASWRRGRSAYYRVYRASAERALEGSVIYLSSCSYFLSRWDFISVASEAITDAGWQDYRIMGSLRGSAPDHVLRGEEYLDYLKGAFIYLE